jgi:hypothetical protein
MVHNHKSLVNLYDLELANLSEPKELALVNIDKLKVNDIK